MEQPLRYLVVAQKTGDPVKMDFLQVQKATFTVRAVNNKLRQQIMQVLSQGQTMSVTELYNSMGLEQSVVSQHLSILRRAGMLKMEKSGKNTFYSLNAERLARLSEEVKGIINL